MIQLPVRASHRALVSKKALLRPIGVGPGSTGAEYFTQLCQYNNYRLCHGNASGWGSSLPRANASSLPPPSSSWLSSLSSRRWLSLLQRRDTTCSSFDSCFPRKRWAVCTSFHHGGGARNHATSTTTTTTTMTTTALATLSSISETPLDSTVPEKPYTVILMQDDLWGDASLDENDINHKDPASGAEFSSMETVFRSTIPRDLGMSFASISIQLQGRSPSRRTASLRKGLQALKDSDLVRTSDAVVVARGPVSSLLAQYYLESYSLKGLVLMDPILLQGSACEEEEEDNDGEGATALVSQISQWFPDDPDSLERFRSDRLLVEANAVPMMVVRTISISSHCSSAWESAAQRVADRHGDADGMYGIVPIVDLTDHVTRGNDELASRLVERIDEWIDEAIY